MSRRSRHELPGVCDIKPVQLFDLPAVEFRLVAQHQVDDLHCAGTVLLGIGPDDSFTFMPLTQIDYRGSKEGVDVVIFKSLCARSSAG